MINAKGNSAKTGKDNPFPSCSDMMPCIVLTASRTGSIEYLNLKWRKTTGKEDAAAGLAGWVENLHPEDRDHFREQWKRAIAAGEPFSHELRVWSEAHQEHRWHILHVRPHADESGAIVRWIGSCEDIHERHVAEQLLRNSEARLKGLIESSPVGVVILSPNGQPVFFNQKCAELRAHELDVSRWQDAIHPEDRERIVATAREGVQRGIPWNAIYRFMHPDGRIIWVSARTVPVRSGPHLVGFVRTLEDITELKETVESLRKANEELHRQATELEDEVEKRTRNEREALAELDMLSYSIVHDMRSPLRAMSAFSKVLLEEYSGLMPDEGKDYLRRIEAAALHQDRLIQDVLLYHSHVRRKISLKTVDLDSVVQSIIDIYPNLQPPNVRVEVHEPLGCVMGDDALLTQAISALLDNAVKFVAPGVTPRVVVSARQAADGIELSIEDNGIGIPAESQGRLFDIFYKFHHATEYPGTGIGLPLAKKAVERMRGSIRVESAPGKGSRFTISLPAAACGGSEGMSKGVQAGFEPA